MTDSVFDIEIPGVDAPRIVQQIRATVAAKMTRNLYTDGRVARAERTNLSTLKDEANFLSFYMECLRDAVFVDIGDFDIFERRARFSSIFVALKRLIWKALKFYTYRLWSQQNQVNGLLLSALDSTESRYRVKIEELEKRISALESSRS